VATGDLDGDGLLDFCISNALQHTFVYQNGGGTSFTAPTFPQGSASRRGYRRLDGTAISTLSWRTRGRVRSQSTSTVSSYQADRMESHLHTDRRANSTKSAIFPMPSRGRSLRGRICARDTLTHGPGYWLNRYRANPRVRRPHDSSDNVPVSSAGISSEAWAGLLIQARLRAARPDRSSAYFGFNGSYQMRPR